MAEEETQAIESIKPKAGFYVGIGSSAEKETPSFVYQNPVDGKWYVKTFLKSGGYHHQEAGPRLFENISKVSEQEIGRAIIKRKNLQERLAKEVCFLKECLEQLTEAKRTDRDEPGTDPELEILLYSPL